MLDQENNYAAQVTEILEQPTPERHPACTLTDAQFRYFVAERKLASINQIIKPLREEVDAALKEVVNESGIKMTNKPSFFQDQCGVVHMIGEQEFTSVPMRPFAIMHTRRPEFGEKRGSLSESDAKAAGFAPVINKGESL